MFACRLNLRLGQGDVAICIDNLAHRAERVRQQLLCRISHILRQRARAEGIYVLHRIRVCL
jgi:hypothetical protein